MHKSVHNLVAALGVPALSSSSGAIISTKRRYGGFAKAVACALTTLHGLGYCKVVILVDEDVDLFNLPQVIWAITTKFNPPTIL